MTHQDRRAYEMIDFLELCIIFMHGTLDAFKVAVRSLDLLHAIQNSNGKTKLNIQIVRDCK